MDRTGGTLTFPFPSSEAVTFHETKAPTRRRSSLDTALGGFHGITSAQNLLPAALFVLDN